MFFSSTNYKRYGMQRIADNGNLIVAVKDPLKTDTYAAFMAKVIAQAPMSAVDVNFATVSEDLRCTINGKNGIDPSDVAAINEDLCMAIVDTVNEDVLAVTDATDRIVTNEAGDLVDLPPIVLWSREMTGVA